MANQLGGGFNSSQIQNIKVLYCLPDSNPGTNVYEVSTFVDGTIDTINFPVYYTNETGDVITLTALQIASLIPGGCNADYEYDDQLVCAAGVTLELRHILVNGVQSGATIFVNPTTGAAVATPAVFTYGACTVQNVPTTNFVRNAATFSTTATAVTIPAGGPYREVALYNRSNFDVIYNWTSTNGGSGSLLIPRQGFEKLQLDIINPRDESFFATNTVQVVGTAPFTGTVPVGLFVINYKN